ncbi:MAG: T9SS type A sorting domain-containing protein [Bacteroidota bacterium]
MKKILTACLGVFLGGICSQQSAGQTQAQFQVPITVTNGTNSQVLYIGVNGDGSGGAIQDNTIGADVEASFGAYQELLAPPAPPAPFAFDVRILTIPGRVSTFPAGLGGGVYRDFRGFVDAASQVDSFRINIAGDDIDVRETVVSWPADMATYASVWTIKPQTGTEWGSVNMTSVTSATIPTAVLQRNIIIIKTGALVGVQPVDNTVPESFRLDQNFPNPFNPSTEIRFSVPQREHVMLTVYNMLGQKVATLVDEVASPGNYSVNFSPSGIASGVYVYRLHSISFTKERKMLLIK